MHNTNERRGGIYYEPFQKTKILLMHNIDPVSFVSRRHYHNMIEIGFMVKGSAGYIVNENNEQISSGEMCYIDSFDIHYFDIKEGNETFTLMINLECLSDFYREYGDIDSVPYFGQALRNKSVNAKVLNILRRWEQEYEPESFLKNQGYLNLVLAELATGYPIKHRANNKRDMGIAGEILEYINQNYQKPITLESTARSIGYGKNYCSKIFHDYINQDFRNYVNSVRVEAAKRMMQECPRKQITDIAYDCGFGSLNTFYRAYKRVYKNLPKRRKGE